MFSNIPVVNDCTIWYCGFLRYPHGCYGLFFTVLSLIPFVHLRCILQSDGTNLIVANSLFSYLTQTICCIALLLLSPMSCRLVFNMVFGLEFKLNLSMFSTGYLWLRACSWADNRVKFPKIELISNVSSFSHNCFSNSRWPQLCRRFQIS